MGEKDGLRGDSLVSSQFMHDDNLCAMIQMAPNRKQETRNTTRAPGANRGVQEATKLNAETRDPPSQDPRYHKEQPFRHDKHPDTLKQTPTTPGRDKSGEKSYRSETGE